MCTETSKKSCRNVDEQCMDKGDFALNELDFETRNAFALGSIVSTSRAGSLVVQDAPRLSSDKRKVHSGD
uniref:Uncharacterized protein n=1 Tax=Peronospora matthiolae TaxID=2874970 RepID=A0AAV1TRA5_9STRA